MLTKSEIEALLILLEQRRVLVLMKSEDDARRFRLYFKERLKHDYHRVYNGYISTGNVIPVKGHECITVTTPEEWRTSNKAMFNGIVLVDDSMRPDDYAPIPLIAESPEKLHEYLSRCRA